MITNVTVYTDHNPEGLLFPDVQYTKSDETGFIVESINNGNVYKDFFPPHAVTRIEVEEIPEEVSP